MERVTYPQLDERARGLVSARVNELRSIAAVARELDVARTSLSQALAGRYPADTRKLRAKILERYADGVTCPALNRDVCPAECRSFRERPLPTSPLSAVKHWQACRHCSHNPNARRIDQ